MAENFFFDVSHSQNLNEAPLESWDIARSSQEIMLPSEIASMLLVFQISILQTVNYRTSRSNCNIIDCTFSGDLNDFIDFTV